MTTITTTTRALRQLVAPVLPLTSKSDLAPILQAVQLRGHGDTLTATATDKYRIGICRARIEAPSGFRALVPATALRRILTLFRETRTIDPELSLEFDEQVVHVSSGGFGLDVEGARITFRLQYGEFPKGADKVIADALTGCRVDELALNASFVGDFAAAMRSSSDAMRVYGGEPGRPVGIAIGDHFRAALMQVRIVDDSGTSPRPLDGGWAELLSETTIVAEPERAAVTS